MLFGFVSLGWIVRIGLIHLGALGVWFKILDLEEGRRVIVYGLFQVCRYVTLSFLNWGLEMGQYGNECPEGGLYEVNELSRRESFDAMR